MPLTAQDVLDYLVQIQKDGFDLSSIDFCREAVTFIGVVPVTQIDFSFETSRVVVE